MAEYRIPKAIIDQRFKRISNVVFERDEKKQQILVHLPGLAFTDFSRAGVPTASSIAKMLDIGGRLSAQYRADYKFGGKGIQMVVLGQTISVSPYFHQRARIIFPMILQSTVAHVGKSTWSVESILTDAELGDVLISSRRSFAVMNVLTGQSEKIPEQMRKDLAENLYKGENRKMEILKNFPDKPSEYFEETIHVRHSDTDALYHSNQASYFNYCMDVAAEGAKLGHFQLLKGDLLSYRIELMECLYKGESLPGDKLDVSVWENVNNPSQLFSQIEKEGRVIWMGRLGFRLGIDSKL